MSTWKPASSVFSGGTEQVKALKGRRVRARASLLQILLHNPAQREQETFDIRAGATGWVANPHPTMSDCLLIAFPANASLQPANLDALVRAGAFKVAVINGPTFKLQFEIESP